MARKKRRFSGEEKEHKRWAKEELDWANYQLGVAEMLVSNGSNYCTSAYDQLMGAREAAGSYLAHIGRATQNPAHASFGPKEKERARAAAAAEPMEERVPEKLMDAGYKAFRDRYRPLAEAFKKICATPAWKMPGEAAPPPPPKTPKAKRVDMEVQRASEAPVEPPIPHVKRTPRERPPSITRQIISKSGGACRLRLVAEGDGCEVQKK